MDIHSLLYEEDNPCKEDKKGDSYYSPLLVALVPIQPSWEPKYEVTFNAPLVSQKVKYYKRFIDNITNEEINSLMCPQVLENETLSLFKIKKLYEKISSRIIRANELIEQNDLQLAFLISSESKYKSDLKYFESTYIFNYFIIVQMWSFLEFQEKCIHFIHPDKVRDLQSLYISILSIPLPKEVFIRERIQQIAPVIEVQEVPKTKNTSNKTHSFTYASYQTFGDDIASLFNCMKDVVCLISPDTKLTDFKKIFSAKDITVPIVWIGLDSQLYYFIKLIYSINKSVKEENQQQWKIACRCFVREDGQHYLPEKLKALHEPQNDKRKTAVEKAAMQLKIK